LVARAADLRRDGQRRNTFNAPVVHHLLIRAGAIEPKYRRRMPQIAGQPNEWTIRELAEQIGVPESTLYNWVQKGRCAAAL
jgi:hypothetical protein